MECIRDLGWKCIESQAGDNRYSQDGQVWTGRRPALYHQQSAYSTYEGGREPNPEAQNTPARYEPQRHIRLIQACRFSSGLQTRSDRGRQLLSDATGHASTAVG